MLRNVFVLIFVCWMIGYTPFAQAASYAVVDEETGRLLVGERAHEPLPIASLTKIWTALLVIEEANLGDVVTISKETTLQEGSSIYLKEGQEITVEALLYGLMLRSGNDAAFALAEHVGGSVEGFVKMMNDRAELAGLMHTHFMNPSGLHHEQHYASSYDMAKMMQIALQNATFRKIASTRYFGGDVTWENKHKLLHEQVGAIAGKTGYTKVAGRTLATYFERGDKHFVVVTLSEPNDWLMHKKLADFIEAQYAMQTIVSKGTYRFPFANVTVSKPFKLLVTIEEQRQLKHLLQISRTTNNAVWHIQLQGETIFSNRVQQNR